MAKIDGEWHFNVKWKGYKLSESTWEPKENFVGASLETVEEFEASRKKRPAFDDLCIMALEGMPKRTGASAIAICQWAEERFDNLPKNFNKEINKALKKLEGLAMVDKIRAKYYLPPKEKITKKRRKSRKDSVRKLKTK